MIKINKKNKYEVKIYFSGFCTYEIEAIDHENAVMEARKLPIKENEILSNLENWFEADEAEKINQDKSHSKNILFK